MQVPISPVVSLSTHTTFSPVQNRHHALYPQQNDPSVKSKYFQENAFESSISSVSSSSSTNGMETIILTPPQLHKNNIAEIISADRPFR